MFIRKGVSMAAISFAGIASGIDTSSLIQSLIDRQRQATVTPLSNKVSSLTDTNSSLGELSGLLKTLKSAADKFRVVNGGTIAKDASSTNENVASAVASNTAASGTYALNVTQKAKNATVSFDARYSSTSSALLPGVSDAATDADRTITFTVGNGAGAQSVGLIVTSTTTLADAVTQFNSKSTSAQASLVNTGTADAPSYAFVVNSTKQGVDDGKILVSNGAAIGAFATTTSQATNAQFSVSGISGTITRPTNTVTDVIQGVSVSVNGTGSSTLTVGNDTTQTSAALQDFVDAYNAVASYVHDNNAITQDGSGDNRKLIFGTLSGTQLDDTLISALRSSISGSSISGNTVNTLADLGITTQRDGSLKLDSAVLQTALDSNPDAVSQITAKLGENLSAVNGTISQYVNYNTLIDQATKTNQTLIDSLNTKVGTIEEQLSRQESSLTARFAKLESLIGKLNSQQSALKSIL